MRVEELPGVNVFSPRKNSQVSSFLMHTLQALMTQSGECPTGNQDITGSILAGSGIILSW